MFSFFLPMLVSLLGSYLIYWTGLSVSLSQTTVQSISGNSVNDSLSVFRKSTPSFPAFAISQTLVSRATMLPQAIADAVIDNIAQQTSRPAGKFTIQEAQESQWPDSCLGLAGAGEFCAQVITPGWRVTVTDGKQTWIYRTDQRGKILRLEE